MHRESPQLSISAPLALQSIQSKGKDSSADNIETFVQFFQPFPYRLDFPHKIVHSCGDRAETTKRVISKNNSIRECFWACKVIYRDLCFLVGKGAWWWMSCKQSLKDASKLLCPVGDGNLSEVPHLNPGNHKVQDQHERCGLSTTLF